MVDKITVGNVSVAVVLDAAPPPFEPNQFYPDVPLQAWEPYKEDHLDENGKFRTNSAPGSCVPRARRCLWIPDLATAGL